jgi:hypothetical protein
MNKIRYREHVWRKVKIDSFISNIDDLSRMQCLFRNRENQFWQNLNKLAFKLLKKGVKKEYITSKMLINYAKDLYCKGNKNVYNKKYD